MRGPAAIGNDHRFSRLVTDQRIDRPEERILSESAEGENRTVASRLLVWASLFGKDLFDTPQNRRGVTFERSPEVCSRRSSPPGHREVGRLRSAIERNDRPLIGGKATTRQYLNHGVDDDDHHAG